MSVDSLQRDAIATANQAGTIMTGFLNSAADVARNLNLNVNLDIPWSASSPSYAYQQMPGKPSLPTTSSIRTPGDAPVFSALFVPSEIPLDALNASAPSISLPSAPNRVMPTAPGAAPDFNAPVVPGALTLVLPNLPTVSELAMPGTPGFVLPTYVRPSFVDDDLLNPTNRFAWEDVEYDSPLLDAIKAKLLSDVQNGGYGIEAADELPLWERAREREMIALNASMDELARQAAARGMTLPDGAYYAGLNALLVDNNAKVAGLSRDIALKRADMYVENRKFSLTQGTTLENILLSFHSAVAERSLNAAKTAVELGVTLYNASIARYNVKLENLKVSSLVYETTLKAALAPLEAYKAQVEGVRVGTEAQRMKVQVYEAQVGALRTVADLYKSRLEGARITAEIEQLKLNAFRSQVEIYTAQVQARSMEFNMYEAQIKGELSKVEIYKAQVGAYAVQIGAYTSRAQAEEARSKVQLAGQQVQLNAYQANVARYTADIHRAVEEQKGIIGLYEADLKATGISSTVAIENARLSAENARATASIAKDTAQVAAMAQMKAAEIQVSVSTLASNIGLAGAKISGDLAQGALQMATGIAIETATK